MMKLPGRGFTTAEFFLEALSLSRYREFREPFLAFAIFLVPAAENNQYSKAAYFRVKCPEILVIFWGGTFGYPLRVCFNFLRRVL